MLLIARASTRTEILKWAMALYAGLSLISMATMGIGAGILFCAILLSSGGDKREWHSESQNYFWISALFSGVLALSLLQASWAPLQFGGQASSIHFFKDLAKIWYLFWPLVLVIGLRRLDLGQRQFVFRSWIFVFALLSAIGIIQHYTGWPRPQWIPAEGERRYHATLFLGHHLSVASIFIFPFFAALDSFFSSWVKGKPQWSLAGAAILGAITLFLTYSRTLWVALPIGLIVWALWVLPKNFKKVAVGLVIVFGLALTQVPAIHQRLLTVQGVAPREDLWEANLEFFKRRPLLGVGWHHNQELSGYYLMEKYHSNDVFSGHAHNNLLDMLGGTGVLGALIWLVWCIFVVRLLFRRDLGMPTSSFHKGLVCAWLVFHLNGLTQMNFWEGKVEHQLAWIIAWSLL